MPIWIARILARLGNWQRRLLSWIYAIVGPRNAYRFSDAGAALIWWLLPPLRERFESQCVAALPELGDVAAREIARRSFIHRVRSLTDLLLARRLLRAGTFARYGGALPGELRGRIADAQRRGQAMIFISAYFGPFDLLPIYLGLNGVRALVVYREHADRGFDDLRRQIREQGGCELVAVADAPVRMSEVLGGGGVVAMIADHATDPRGVPVTFMGLATTAQRVVALLAVHYNAEIVVGGMRRAEEPFHVEWKSMDVIRPADWAGADDPVVEITRRYTRGLEQLVRSDLTQYLWGYQRWARRDD